MHITITFLILNNLYCVFDSFSWISIAVKSLSCGQTAQGSDFKVGKTYTVQCESVDCGGSVWGCPKWNGFTTSDSVVCRVAKMLGISAGTPFTLRRTGRQSSYSSCTMNGITTRSYGAWGGSFQLLYIVI